MKPYSTPGFLISYQIKAKVLSPAMNKAAALVRSSDRGTSNAGWKGFMGCHFQPHVRKMVLKTKATSGKIYVMYKIL